METETGLLLEFEICLGYTDWATVVYILFKELRTEQEVIDEEGTGCHRLPVSKTCSVPYSLLSILNCMTGFSGSISTPGSSVSLDHCTMALLVKPFGLSRKLPQVSSFLSIPESKHSVEINLLP